MENLIQKLNHAIDVEYDSKNTEIDELQKIPVAERVLKGDTIDNVTAHFEGLQALLGQREGEIVFSKVRVTCSSNISKYREGASVVLSGHGESHTLDLVEDNGEEMTLEVGWNFRSVAKHLNGRSGWRLDPAKVDIRSVVKKSTTLLSNNPQKLIRISGILNGSIRPQASAGRRELAWSLASSTDLNDKQKEAFVEAYATETYCLIQGPPGTGKTKVLAHLANAFAQEGKKVLIAASTHTAINNALQKASVFSKNPHIFKVGKKNQMENLNENGSTAKNMPDFGRSGYRNDSKGIIVGATCYSPHTKKLEFMDWDVVIIDEAGQLGIPLAVAAMVKAEKYIFIGDHKQLPPIVTDKNTDPAFSKSIFEHLFQFTEGTMLETTYRMNSSINAFPSKYFYNNKVKAYSKNASWLLEINNNFSQNQSILDVTKPEVLVVHDNESISARSAYEAELAASYVKQYLAKGVEPGEIGVITPFRAQVRQIKKALASLGLEANVLEKLFVDTIERIQGQEKDIIIYSLATSNPEKAMQRANFFYNLNRLNVALTRARKKRIVIANKDLFTAQTGDAEFNRMKNVFRAFYQESYVVEQLIETPAETDFQF